MNTEETIPAPEPAVNISALKTEVENSNYISRDLSWIQFNYRVLDQAMQIGRAHV